MNIQWDMNRKKEPPAGGDGWESSKEIASEAYCEFRKIAERGKRAEFVKSVLIMIATSVGFPIATHFVLCLLAQFF